MLKPICPTEECTGCMACTAACAHAAIDIIVDPLGFSYPQIETDRCTGCGLCERVCPQLSPRQLTLPQESLAAVMKDTGELLSCASGGAATALAVGVIRRGGVVVGCSGRDMPHVRHVMVRTIEGLSELKGSKYVQSDISADLLRSIRRELQGGREVLFIGTGCQVAGVRNYLIRDYTNLITVDLVCHGVPSRKMLAENMKHYPGIDPSTVAFRAKNPKANGPRAIRYGWSATTHSGLTANRIFISYHRDPYLAAFIDCLDFRPGCYRCQYARPQRGSDLTLADYWGLAEDAVLADTVGVSLILVNTSKGRAAVDSVSDILTTERRSVDEAIRGNGQLQHPSESNPRRDEFERIFLSDGFVAAARRVSVPAMRRKYIRHTYLYPARSRVGRLIPGALKTAIKKLIGR